MHWVWMNWAVALTGEAYIVHLRRLSGLPEVHAKGGGENLGLLHTTGLADGYAPVAAGYEHAAEILNQVDDLFNGFGFGDDHAATSVADPSEACFAVLMGLGPRLRTFSVISRAISANLGPCPAERLYIVTRSPPTPTFSSISFTYATRFLALKLPSW